MSKSSANNFVLHEMKSTISSMYVRKSVGPRTDPWGTPDVTGFSSDIPLSRTFFLPVKNDFIYFSNSMEISKFFSNFCNRRPCNTLSKAYEKSKNVVFIHLPLSTSLEFSCNSPTNCVVYDRPFLKPCGMPEILPSSCLLSSRNTICSNNFHESDTGQ